MVGEGGDWNLSSTTVTTLWLLSHRGWKFWCIWPLFFTPSLSVCRLIQLFHRISTLTISLHKYNVWLDMVEIGIWSLRWPPQPIFQLWEGTNLAWPLAHTYFLHPDWCVSTDWFKQFTASQPFQWFKISIISGSICVNNQNNIQQSSVLVLL